MDVKNAGDRAGGKEVVQLNLHEADVLVSIPVERLRGSRGVAPAWARASGAGARALTPCIADGFMIPIVVGSE